MQGEFKKRKYSKERMEDKKVETNLSSDFLNSSYPPDCKYCHTGPIHTFDCSRPRESAYQDAKTQDVVLWLFVLVAALLLVSVFIYVKTQCHMVVVYVEEHSISYMTGRAPMHATVPAGEQEVMECK